MKTYTTLNIGNFHTNNCEDFLVTEQIADDEILIAVLDGCTMGKESVFASILYGKVLRNISKKMFYEDFSSKKNNNLKIKLKQTIKQLFEDSIFIKNKLGLETNELLSTLIIGLVNTKTFNAEFLAIGDGLICIDGKLIEYEQNDKPDYIGYHLNEEFNDWFDNQNQKLSIEQFNDISIATDGIFTFKNFKDRTKQKTENQIIEDLLIDSTYSKFNNLLDRKIKILKETENHIVTDDLAIIRLINL